ncbi:MAG TPA: Maf family protein [Thermodesulfobacteriota bacterium]|nr:septum formation inhibitor Maf [Deltaproteobacteria bacterium]HNR13126.1 Maf family protein [Thermodesulfobacteriota bacterium]HOC37795.1 Maf family protein [Thermodesulfobacteriota bacterium]HQO78394.1 Maf family protein [Thermodesulfobacteriota bacterium]
MKDSPGIILASASPRRQQLLSILRLHFEVIPADVDETPLPGETPREHVARLSRAKAMVVAAKEQDRWIIAADTIVFLDGEILGKPVDAGESCRMLRKLSGREHTVMTGVFIVHPSKEQSFGTVVESFVKIKELSDAEISGYIATGEPFDKAGAYAIQGIGMFMVEKVRGSYTNVIGLPMCELVNALRQVGAIRFME